MVVLKKEASFPPGGLGGAEQALDTETTQGAVVRGGFQLNFGTNKGNEVL